MPSFGTNAKSRPALKLSAYWDRPEVTGRRATAQTESPLVAISATIRALSSSHQVRRRPAPVNTSSRRTGSVIAVSTVSILSPTVKTRPQTRRSGHHPEGGHRTALTIKRSATTPKERSSLYLRTWLVSVVMRLRFLAFAQYRSQARAV